MQPGDWGSGEVYRGRIGAVIVRAKGRKRQECAARVRWEEMGDFRLKGQYGSREKMAQGIWLKAQGIWLKGFQGNLAQGKR